MNLLDAPPGFLDLPPWRPSPDFPHHSPNLTPSLWSHLPNNLLHSILACLPFESILRFRGVCRQWKALFDSPSFNDLFASHSASRLHPWIFFTVKKNDTLWGSHNAPPAHPKYDDGHDDNGFVFLDDGHGEIDHTSLTANDASSGAHDDHGDMHDALSSDSDATDHGDQQDATPITNQRYPSPEELFLIFDCKSESWRPPKVLRPGYRATYIGYLQEQVLLSSGPLGSLFLFNPASLPCKLLPPCNYIKKVKGQALAERTAGISSRFSSMSKEDNRTAEPRGHDTMLKDMLVVAIGESHKGNYAVESFDFVTGVWHVCGEHDPISMGRSMVYCKGSIYITALNLHGVLILDNFSAGQNLEWTYRASPTPQRLELVEMRLVATKDSVLSVRIAVSLEDWDENGRHTDADGGWSISIWQLHPYAPEDACWELLAYTPKSILEGFYSGGLSSSLDCCAHGNLVFFHAPGSQRFLIYDMPQKLWRFSAKCKYKLGLMAFVWEPLLRK